MGLQLALAKTRIRKKSKWKTKADEDTLVDGWQRKPPRQKSLAILLFCCWGILASRLWVPVYDRCMNMYQHICIYKNSKVDSGVE